VLAFTDPPLTPDESLLLDDLCFRSVFQIPTDQPATMEMAAGIQGQLSASSDERSVPISLRSSADNLLGL
jgi:hypothetical protein